MKRIIDGVAYNTDTSTVIARSEYEGEYNHRNSNCIATLYQTRGGAFFVVETFNLGWDEETRLDDIRDRFKALSAERAQNWIMTGEVEIIHNPFGEPPEATAEAEASATLYTRVPVSLKQRIEAAARDDGLSGNAWLMRCAERCLSARAAS